MGMARRETSSKLRYPRKLRFSPPSAVRTEGNADGGERRTDSHEVVVFSREKKESHVASEVPKVNAFFFRFGPTRNTILSTRM